MRELIAQLRNSDYETGHNDMTSKRRPIPSQSKEAMSDKPFPEALSDLLTKHDITLRTLASKTQTRFDGWGSITTLSHYNTGKLKPTPKAIERIADALNEPADYFAEYRLAIARAQLDPEQVPLEVALKSLARFDGQPNAVLAETEKGITERLSRAGESGKTKTKKPPSQHQKGQA